jgi:hypothetical protein
VDDLFADVDGRTEGFERDADNVNSPHYAGAESTRLQ